MSVVMGFDWSSLGCCGHLWSELGSEILSLSLLPPYSIPLTLLLYISNKNNEIEKEGIVCDTLSRHGKISEAGLKERRRATKGNVLTSVRHCLSLWEALGWHGKGVGMDNWAPASYSEQ